MSNGVTDTVTVSPLKRLAENAIESGIDSKIPNTTFQRIKKKKHAILICYSGKGYLGLQRNPGAKTIEEDVLKAFLLAKLIDEEAYNQPKIVGFQRAARTDKGVSAVQQVLSLKLPLDVNPEVVNSFLPEQIRMVALKRSTNGFNCRRSCDARTYSYMIPSFAFVVQEQPSLDFRIANEVIENLREVLQVYLGTHKYHNFTSRKKALDPSASRYIMDFTCSDPVIYDEMEFLILKVKGQSFMLHQIRKMVGLAVAIVRGHTVIETITKAWAEEHLDLPMAPSIGLVLEEIHYDHYNKRYGDDGIHEAIEWSKEQDQLNEFKKKFILSSIINIEKEEKSMLKWLETLPIHSYDVRDNRDTQNKDDTDEKDEEEEEKEKEIIKDEKISDSERKETTV